MRPLLVLALLACSGAALAQSFPAKPIRIVIPYPPGGIDPSLRAMAPKMTELLGQPIIVDNRPGANGIIGAELVAAAPPDGYTLLFAAPSTMVSGILLSKNTKLDTLRDFTPISDLYGTLRLLTVHSSVPVASLREFIDYAKRNPGKLSYGSGGIGSSFHLDTENLKQAAGIDMVHVPYKGTGPMTADHTAGRVEVLIVPLVNVGQHIASGKLKALAVVDPKRSPRFPDLPAVAELYPSVVRVGGWIGLFGPAKLPRPVVQRLNEAAVAAMKTPELRAFHDKSGAEINATTPEEFVADLKADLERTARIIKAVGIEPE